MEMDKQKRKEFNKKTWWGPVDSKELAEYMVKEIVKAFYLVAVIEAVIGVLFMPVLILNAVLFALVAYWLSKTRSQIAAIVLLLLSILAVLGTLMSIAIQSGGGVNLVLAVLLFWISIRAVQATGKLASTKSHE